MNAAQKLYASIGGTAAKAAFGSLRGWGIDLRNPHTRKAGSGRKGVHVQGPSLLSKTTPRTCPSWWGTSVFSFRRMAYKAGE